MMELVKKAPKSKNSKFSAMRSGKVVNNHFIKLKLKKGKSFSYQNEAFSF